MKKKRVRRPEGATMEQRILGAVRERGGLTATGIVKKAHVGGRDRQRLYRELDRLQRTGKLVRQGEGFALAAPARPAVPARGEELEAVIVSLQERFGFARRDETDYFIPGRLMRGAMPGDRVLLLARPSAKGGSLMEGEVLKILEESDEAFTGVLSRRRGVCEVMPDSGARLALTVPPGQVRGARDGDKVVARLMRRGERHADHRAQVLTVTGSAQDARACAQALVLARGVPEAFSQQALEQARRLEQAGPAQQGERLDLREREIFTIDGAGAKDLDDAVSLRALDGGGWELGVHIADVSAYVTPRTPLDEEAYERGTSIYYADRVIPMLPPALSNGACSLSAGEDRLTLSCLMTLDENGGLAGFEFHKALIRSRVRGVYEEVNALLTESASGPVREKYADILPTLRQMDELARRLREAREARGAVDLTSTESGFVFDEDGVVRDVAPRVTGRAESLIEEFMLLCNQAAASFGERRELPFVYRIHEDPPAEKVEALYDLLRRLGVRTGPAGKTPPPAALREILESVRGGELEAVVNAQILRTMAKARYSETNAGHYGLALRRYSHFTSPIRRYPDLLVHRVISDALAGLEPEKMNRRYGAFAAAAAKQSSEREQRAAQLERDCSRCFAAQVMAQRVGRVYDGVISSAAPHGLYVLLPNSVEGLVRVTALEDDDYDYDGAVAWVGRRLGRRYRVGDPMRVLVLRADVATGQVDFAPARDAAPEKPPKRPAGQSGQERSGNFDSPKIAKRKHL